MRFFRFTLQTLRNTAISLCLFQLLACSSTEEEAIVTPIPYSEKISNVTISDSLVYFSVEVADGRFELFSVNPATGIRNGISDVFSAENNLHPLSVSGDGTRVAYRADKNNDGVDELYSNLIDGDSEALLSNTLETANSDHINWQWMPNSSRIIFRSDPDGDGIFQIQSILPDGTDLQTISSNLTTTCDLETCWQIASDSSSITFKIEATSQNSEISQNLYSVSAEGSNLTLLNQVLNSDSRIHDWRFSPDNSLIAYISQNIGEVNQLYTVNSDTSQRTLINTQSITIGVESFEWSPDSTRIAYTDDSLVAGLANLYVDFPDASDRIQLIDTFEVANPVLFDWQWSPDSSRIAYSADQEIQGTLELFTVENDGQWHRRMNALLPENGVLQNEWQWSPLGDFIAFYAEINPDRVYDELYSSAADGSSRNQVNILHNRRLHTTRQHWTPDGTRLIYSTIDDDGKIIAIYSVLNNGSQVIQITNVLEGEQSIKSDFQISPDSSKIIYQIDSSDGNTTSLHLGSVNTSSRVNLATIGVVSQAYWSMDSTRVIYVIKNNEDISEKMFSILTDGTGKVRLY